jgi:hypothetical protein
MQIVIGIVEYRYLQDVTPKKSVSVMKKEKYKNNERRELSLVFSCKLHKWLYH